MSVTTLNAAASVEDVLDVIDRDGCVIIRELASAPLMDAITAELEPYFNRTPNGEGYFVGRITKRMGALIVKSVTSRELVMNPTILGVMDAVLGPHCASYQLNLTRGIRICPGEVEQVLHRDDELFPFQNDGFECMVNALWAYDDFTAENGATRVVPGSHRENLDREPPPDRVIAAEMPRGSVLLYLGSVIHGGGSNRARTPRTALVASYSLGWLRQAENQYLAVPPDIARTMPPDLQRLAGYAIHAPNLGWIEGQDPGVVLRPGVVETLAAKDYMPPEIEAMLKERDALLRAS